MFLFRLPTSPSFPLKQRRFYCPLPIVADLASLLNLCTSLKHICQIHGFMVSRGFDQDNLLLSTFIDACAALGFSDYAYSVFTHKARPNIYLYNTTIKALSVTHFREAVLVYNQILFAGLLPDTYSVPFALKAVDRLSKVEVGRQIHSQSIGYGLDSDVHVVAALIQMYSSCGCICDARKLFDRAYSRNVALWNAMVAGYVKVGNVDDAQHLFERMPERNVISWTALITGYAEMNRPNDAIAIFQKMQLSHVEPDKITMLVALSACADMGALELGECIHIHVVKNGLHKIVPLNNALIDMYAKSGNINKALRVFENMNNKNVVTWTTMIAGLALHGLARQSLEMFSHMERARIKPNEITFLAILSACAHVGLVELGWRYFNCMILRYGIEPKIEHYGCMIDLIGRAGYLQEALDLVREMPFKANGAMWGSLLAASRIHGDAELGKHAMQYLIDLEPHNSGNYMLLSNTYAAFGRWSEAGMVRKVMRDSGVKKMPGWSFIEVNYNVNGFMAGDNSHPQSERICQVLFEINWQLKMDGNVRKECEELLTSDDSFKSHWINNSQ